MLCNAVASQVHWFDLMQRQRSVGVHHSTDPRVAGRNSQNSPCVPDPGFLTSSLSQKNIPFIFLSYCRCLCNVAKPIR